MSTVAAQPKLIRVRFTGRVIIPGAASYMANEIAGLPEATARDLIEQGLAIEERAEKGVESPPADRMVRPDQVRKK